MKSIQNQYRDLKEGKMSQANFMRNVRMTFPNLVTNVTSFDDSIKILKNKGMLIEAYNPDESNFEMAIKDSLETLDISDEVYEDAVKALENPKIVKSLSGLNADRAAKALVKMIEQEHGEFGAAMQKHKEEEMGQQAIRSQYDLEETLKEVKKSEKEGYWDQNGKSEYEKFAEKNNVNGNEYMNGMHMEYAEAPGKTMEEYSKIVIKNLKKNPNYYTNYKLTGIRDYKLETMDKTNTPEATAMKPFKGENGVDKALGMKPVKNIEKPKADAGAKEEKVKNVKVDIFTLAAKTLRGVKKMEATGEKMKKIVMKEAQEGQYTFNGYFKKGEEAKLKQMIPDAEIDHDEEEGQTIKTTVYSKKYNDKTVKHAVESTLGLIKPSKPMSSGEAVAKALTKETLTQMIREAIAEIYDGRDNMTDLTDDTED